MTFRDKKIIIYKWILNYLKENGETEFNKLRALISVNHGSAKTSSYEILQDLKESEEIKIVKKDKNRVVVCLSE